MKYLNAKLESGHEFPLADWMGSDNFPNVPKRFIAEFYRIKAYRITLLAEKLANRIQNANELIRLEQDFIEKYNNETGEAKIEEQTTLSMQICFGLYKDFEKIKKQLIAAVEYGGSVMRCGMVGVQYLYDALTICDEADLAFEIITTSNPGYRTWYECGATTLWEIWDGKDIGSHNHHMYSNVLGWFIKDLLGFEIDENVEERDVVHLHPHFVKRLDFCQGHVTTAKGRLTLSWRRERGQVVYNVYVPQGLNVDYKGKALQTGENKIIQIEKSES